MRRHGARCRNPALFGRSPAWAENPVATTLIKPNEISTRSRMFRLVIGGAVLVAVRHRSTGGSNDPPGAVRNRLTEASDDASAGAPYTPARRVIAGRPPCHLVLKTLCSAGLIWTAARY